MGQETPSYSLVTTEAELDRLCEELSESPLLAVDTETEGIHYKDVIVGIAITGEINKGYYIPIRHEAIDGIKFENQLTPEQVFSKLGPILAEKPCTGHNVKFDLQMFWKEGIDVNFVHDTLIMAALIGTFRSKGLKPLTELLLGHKMTDLAELFATGTRKKPVIQPKILNPEEIREYAGEDANWSLQLYNKLYPMMKDQMDDLTLYTVEMKLVRAVAEMESFGVPVDLTYLRDNSKKAEKILKRLEQVMILILT